MYSSAYDLHKCFMLYFFYFFLGTVKDLVIDEYILYLCRIFLKFYILLRKYFLSINNDVKEFLFRKEMEQELSIILLSQQVPICARCCD